MRNWRPLRAGPLDLYFAEGDLRRIRLGEREVLSRVYAAVRDRDWGTVLARIENLQVVESGRHFTVTYDAIHQQGPVDFRWRATITGTDAGQITFALDGKAHSTFLRNRIGLCVHHPLRECAGQSCTILHPDGTREASAFPSDVAPNQPFLNVAGITHEVAPGLRAEVRFHGEVFETEDHRNWTDANFKTYGTPLSAPFPIEIAAGTELHQLIELVLHGERPDPSRTPAGHVRVRALGAPAVPLPRLGLALESGARPLTASEMTRLRSLSLSHVRVDLSGGLDAQAESLGIPLEAAVTMPAEWKPLRHLAAKVRHWLIYHRDEASSSEETMRAAREALGPEAVIAAGTNANFAELNRNRPKGSYLNAACFPVNPQVHAFDDASLMENTAGQAEAVRTARGFLKGLPVFVTPVRLRAQVEADPRQKLAFCAAWTVASLASLARAGAESFTYFETHGPRGVMDGDTVYPVYQVFRAVAEFRNGAVAPTEVSDPLRVAALVLTLGARRRMLLANLTDTAQDVVTDLQPEPVTLAPYGIRVLD